GGGGPGGGSGGFRGGTPPNGAAGGGMFGGNTAELTSALTYIRANGGGTLVISSQSGASQSIIQSGADVAAIGGFSGSETVVTAQWLANAVASGQIRWILVSGSSGGGIQDGRVGATEAMAIAAKVGKAVTSVDGLYDLQGTASAILAAA
ncbi:MAG TPA: hypothetical protein VI300_04820, partial [Solirubrobacter sp.]